MNDYGIKISRTGFDVRTANPHELAFSSKYKTLKISTRGSGSVDSASGGGLVTIAHGLGYVPVFFVHVDPGTTGNYFLIPYAESDEQYFHAYADSTNLYIKATADINTTDYTTNGDQYNYAFEYDGVYSKGGMYAGEGSLGDENGAFRFPGIALTNSQSNITSASLRFYVNVRSGSSLVKLNIRGIDEDNTADFNTGTAVFARTRTTANLLSNTNLSAGSYSNENVKNIVEEIIGRAGWSSGNAMAFTLDDNGTTAVNDYNTDYTVNQTYLRIITTTHKTANYKYTIFLNQLE